ncbi:SH3 domain-containing protein [Campylobacter helveticus]|uniref:SH3 domain-containing protein n=1 Tax=Campylobacter helveticus TaxID=28898 RepID=UPI0022EAEB2E|nr:SH3 domain-containing protein [Campylobacter helveticus]
MIKQKQILLSFITASFLCGCGMLPYKESFSCEKGKENGICGSVSEVYDLSSDMEEFRKKANKEYAKEAAKKEQNKSKISDDNGAFKQLKLQEMVEAVEIRKIQNETPTIFRYYLDEKEAKEKAGLAIVSENDKESKAIKKDLNANKQSNHHKEKKTQSSTSKNHNAKVVKKNKDLKELKELNATNSKEGIVIYDDNQSLDFNQSKALDFNASLNELNSSINSSQTNDLNNTLQNTQENCSPNANEAITQINDTVKVCVYSANIRAGASCKAPVLRVAFKGEVLEALYEKGGWIKLKDGTYVHKSIVTKD